MRNFISILILFPLVVFGQLTDTTCIKSRWIALKPNEINKEIFLLDSTFSDSLDLVFVIKKLVEEKKLKIYTQNSGPYGTKGWYYIDYQREIEENLKDTMSFWNTDPYFQTSEQSDYPMVDEYGDPLVVLLPDGTQTYKYPPPNIYVFPAKKCDEIRIKEDWLYNEKTKKLEFVPVGISFYFKGGKYWRGNEKFWVDLNQLFNVIDKKSNYPWYNALINKKYQGFQYMQVSYYDDEIKN